MKHKSNQKNKSYTMFKLTGALVGLLYRLCKTICFNIFIFIVGFCVGYIVISSEVHACATKHTNAEYINKLTDYINRLDYIYEKDCIPIHQDMIKLLNNLKMQQAHDVHVNTSTIMPSCETKIGKMFWK